MVFYFQTRNGTMIYVGRDKFENEELIKYGWPEDIWFHVDDMSSAHVYIRLEEGQTIDDIHPLALEDCSQLVKFRSIQGKKKGEVVVIYTPWSNLRKGQDMEVGAVSFHDQKLVRKVRVSQNKEILKLLGKTMTESYPNLSQEKQDRDDRERKAHNERKRKQKQLDKEEKAERQRLKAGQSYDGLFSGTEPSDNAGFSPYESNLTYDEYEDSFM